MTSGWIICLAVVSQTSAWGTTSNGWQAAPNTAAQQMRYGTGVQQPAQTTTNQFSTAPQFASQQQQPGSQFAQQQPQQPMVDQYGRPLNTTQNADQQQAGQQAAQHPWQNNGTQFASNQPTAAQQNQNQNWGQQNYDPRIAANNLAANNQAVNNQNVSLAPNGVAAQNNYQQQPNPNWQQYNAQQGTNQLQLASPQQNTSAQNQWQNQPQTTYDPRTNQSPGFGQQYTSTTGNSNWGAGQQQQGGQPTGGGQFASQNPQAGNQFNNSLRNPQLDASVNSGGSQFGAQINLGDNRFRVADNTHSVLQGANQFANQGGQAPAQQQQPTLALQPPLQGTLPAGSNQSGDFSQQNVNPHVLVQPPRVGDNTLQGTVAIEDNRWTNLQQPTDATQLASRPTSSDLQPIPAGQTNNGQTQSPANNGQTGGGTNQTFVNQPVPQIPTTPQVNAPAGNLFGSLANRNTNTQPTAFGQNSQATGLPKDGLFAAASRNAQAQGSMLNKPAGSEDGYTPSPFAFGVSLVFNFLMVGGVMYLGWIAFESHFRYRRALLDGDDVDDRHSSRDDDRGSRRR